MTPLTKIMIVIVEALYCVLRNTPSPWGIFFSYMWVWAKEGGKAIHEADGAHDPATDPCGRATWPPWRIVGLLTQFFFLADFSRIKPSL
jgi:hypothetical protein